MNILPTKNEFNLSNNEFNKYKAKREGVLRVNEMGLTVFFLDLRHVCCTRNIAGSKTYLKLKMVQLKNTKGLFFFSHIGCLYCSFIQHYTPRVTTLHKNPS